MARLRDVCSIRSSNHSADKDKNWLLNLDVVEQQTGRVLEYFFVPESGLDGSIISFDTDNVLYSKLRPNLNKVVIPEKNGYATSEMLPLYPDTKQITREYLACYLRSPGFVEWAVSKTAGAKMPRLGTKELLNKEIPLPSIDLQKRITESLFLIDSLISLRKKQLQKLDDLVKSRFVEMFGSIHDSLKYPYHLIKNLTEVVSGGTPSRDNPEYWNNGTIPWVKTTELRNNVISDVEEYITQKGHDESSAKLVPPNTVLIAMYGQGKTRGMTALLGVSACTNQACACILPSDKINPVFLWKYFELSYDKLRNLAKGGNQPNLNCNMIKNFPVLLPPLKLQEEYVSYIVQIDKTKQQLQQGLDKLEQMKQALMQKYFG